MIKESIFVKSECSVKEAIKKMDENGMKILLVVDDESRLLGTVTDGDIRRFILKGKELNLPLTDLYNDSPVFVYNYYSPELVKKLMLDHKIEVIPVINNKKQVVAAISWNEIFREPTGSAKTYGKIDVPVVIMAGGKGTRLDPFTRILPKPLIPVGEKTILEIIMDKFSRFGVPDFYFTLNYKAEIIKSYLEEIEHTANYHYVKEEQFLGTAGSLKLLPENIGDDFFVSNCDIIVDADYYDLLQYHRKNKLDLTMVGSLHHFVIPYGTIEFEEDGLVKRIVEKPEHNITINTGVYVLNREVIDFIPGNSFFHITDLIDKLMKEGRRVGVYPITQNSFIDIGQWKEYKDALKKFEI